MQQPEADEGAGRRLVERRRGGEAQRHVHPAASTGCWTAERAPRLSARKSNVKEKKSEGDRDRAWAASCRRVVASLLDGRVRGDLWPIADEGTDEVKRKERQRTQGERGGKQQMDGRKRRDLARSEGCAERGKRAERGQPRARSERSNRRASQRDHQNVWCARVEERSGTRRRERRVQGLERARRRKGPGGAAPSAKRTRTRGNKRSRKKLFKRACGCGKSSCVRNDALGGGPGRDGGPRSDVGRRA